MSWGDDNGNKGPWGGSPWGKTPPPRGNGGRRFEPPPNFDFEVLIKKIQGKCEINQYFKSVVVAPSHYAIPHIF